MIVIFMMPQVSREFELKCFLGQNPQFMNWKRYVMDPHKDDPVCFIPRVFTLVSDFP